MKITLANLIVRGSLFVVLLSPAVAWAGDADDASSHNASTRVESSASNGGFLPVSHSASVGDQGALATASGGYDGARRNGLFEATAEVHVWGPIAVRGGAVYTGSDNRLRPTFGARLQALRERAHGVDATIGVFYRPEGLTEPEGEIEAVISAGRHLGRTYVLANLVYGQDPEARERDGEVRLAGLVLVSSRLILGMDGRLRLNLGANNTGKGEPTLDAVLGPVATVPLGPVAILVHGGGSVVKLTTTQAGPFVLAGLGSSF
jgi:hypothetical protein